MNRVAFALNPDFGDPPRDADAILAAGADCSVLITADQEVAAALAEKIHNTSARYAAPFVTVHHRSEGDLAAAAVLASEGTLFICGVDSLSPEAQEELKTLLLGKADSGIGPRIIAADTGMLFAHVVAERFDTRLFYRLNTIHIRPAVEETSLASIQRPVLDVPDTLRTTPGASETLPAGSSVFYSLPAIADAPAVRTPLRRRSRSSHGHLFPRFKTSMTRIAEVCRRAGQNASSWATSLWSASLPQRSKVFRT